MSKKMNNKKKGYTTINYLFVFSFYVLKKLLLIM